MPNARTDQLRQSLRPLEKGEREGVKLLDAIGELSFGNGGFTHKFFRVGCTCQIRNS